MEEPSQGDELLNKLGENEDTFSFSATIFFTSSMKSTSFSDFECERIVCEYQ